MKLLLALMFVFVAQVGHAQVKLYAIDCGRIDTQDFGWFADTGDFDKKAVDIISPCFLITHPKGKIIWDFGIAEDFAFGALNLKANTKIVENLKLVNLTPKDITHVAFSHLHVDHVGNVSHFKDATWIMNEEEWKTINPKKPEYKFLTGYKKAKKATIQGDHDVFGDGSVVIIQSKGHSHGHQALFVNLPKAGKFILSGDLYHQRESREKRLVPTFNISRADTLASMDRVEGMLRAHKAKLIIQHDLNDFKTLPEFPAYLE